MPDPDKALQKSTPERPLSRTALGLEQILYACGGYIGAQLLVNLTFTEPSDGDYLVYGIAGAIIGVVLHVLVRGLGVKIPGIGLRFRMRVAINDETRADVEFPRRKTDRASRYAAALAMFKRPRRKSGRKSEAPDNEEKIVKTPEGYRVGDRIFERKVDAEDYLYLGNEKNEREAEDPSITRHPRRAWRRKGSVLNAIILAFVLALIAIAVGS